MTEFSRSLSRFKAVTARSVIWLAFAVVLLVFAGCGDHYQSPVYQPPVHGNDNAQRVDLAKAKRFKKFKLYYVGKSFKGLRLTSMAYPTSFEYGDCDAESKSFADEGGCALPLEIQNWSICERYPTRFSRSTKVFDFHGMQAAHATPATLEVYTGHTTVVIFGDESAAKYLRQVNTKKRALRLPPPPQGALAGRLPCQKPYPPRNRFEKGQ